MESAAFGVPAGNRLLNGLDVGHNLVIVFAFADLGHIVGVAE